MLDCEDVCCRELLDVKVEDARLGLEVSGLVSNANYNVKRAMFLLFINSESLLCVSPSQFNKPFSMQKCCLSVCF